MEKKFKKNYKTKLKIRRKTISLPEIDTTFSLWRSFSSGVFLVAIKSGTNQLTDGPYLEEDFQYRIYFIF